MSRNKNRRSRKATMIIREMLYGWQQRDRTKPHFLRPSKEPLSRARDGFWVPIESNVMDINPMAWLQSISKIAKKTIMRGSIFNRKKKDE